MTMFWVGLAIFLGVPAIVGISAIVSSVEIRQKDAKSSAELPNAIPAHH